jgi:hypothetical protein
MPLSQPLPIPPLPTGIYEGRHPYKVCEEYTIRIKEGKNSTMYSINALSLSLSQKSKVSSHMDATFEPYCQTVLGLLSGSSNRIAHC